MNYPWEPIADGVCRCRLPFLDVTVGLVTGDTGVLLVDTGTTLTDAAALGADVYAITGRPVSHIVLTHKHFDHILGSSGFAGAEIYCAPAVAEYMPTAGGDLRADALRHGSDAVAVDSAIAALRPPDHQVTDAVVDLGNRCVSVSYPGRGHTHSDLIVVVAAGEPEPVVFCGDLVEESGDPVADDDSDLDAWPATLDRVLEIGGQYAAYVPGHGAVVDASFIRRQQEWLRTCRSTE